jgi:D-3-phosphoglycerate dehydrogenase
MTKVLIAQPIHSGGIRLLAARPDIRCEVLESPTAELMAGAVGDAEALIIREAPLPAAVVAAAPLLKIVSRHGVGVDNVPVDLCTERGIAVTVVGGANAVAVAEHALYLMLAVARHGVRLDRAVRAGDFAARTRFTAVELRGRTLLIVGFGRVGRELGPRARALGMNLIAFAPMVDRARHPDIRFCDRLEQGLAEADILSLHLPLTPSTRGMIGAAELARLRPGAILINTARGGIVDESALVAALDSGHLRGAGIDTFETEPLPLGHPLVTREDVVLTPHTAAATEEGMIAMATIAAQNALDGIDGRLNPALVVNPTVLEALPRAPGSSAGWQRG